ncbi:MAG: hypothetical protein GX751_12325, partial [Desulfuromonadaceae bacterium]|nr:hypothetical protein [Desulfuromonadaceae bacterium]
MGKGTIISADGEGRYTLRIDYHVERIKAERARLLSRLGGLRPRLLALEAQFNSAALEYDYQEEVLRAAISAADPEKMRAANAAVKSARDQLYRINAERRQTALDIAAAERRLASIGGVPENQTVEAWCADHTEELSGEVGTIEAGRVPGEEAIILPGHDGTAAYDAARDGQLQPVKASGPAAAYFNYAMLPGFAKWRPRYRLGTIREIDTAANTCRVDLDPVSSTHDRHDVNQAEILENVPVRYMTCNAGAFEEGDHVVVKFEGESWESPVVIGFVREPKRCPNYLLIVMSGTPSWVQPSQSYWSTEAWCVVVDAATGNLANLGLPQPCLLTDFEAAFDGEETTAEYASPVEFRTVSAGGVFGSTTPGLYWKWMLSNPMFSYNPGVRT